MNAVEFVRAVAQVVRDASVADAVSIVEKPPGRRPRRDLIELTNWYTRLSAEDQKMTIRMLELVAQQSLFGFLSVLDGARQVERAEGPKGYLELRYIDACKVEVLSGPSGEVLHELLE